ncbi:hypothetical protein CF326_g7875 [Tilletia indica]|nr:hypothetical protein CF326_g7875 [Tilletia indica]
MISLVYGPTSRPTASVFEANKPARTKAAANETSHIGYASNGSDFGALFLSAFGYVLVDDLFPGLAARRLASDEAQVLQEGSFAAPPPSQYMATPPRATQARRSGSASLSAAPPKRSGVGALRSGSHSMRLVSSATASSSRVPAPASSSVPGAFTSAQIFSRVTRRESIGRQQRVRPVP